MPRLANIRLVVCVIHDLLCNRAISLHDDLVDVKRGLDRVGLVVNPFELLKGTALGLDALREGKVLAHDCFLNHI